MRNTKRSCYVVLVACVAMIAFPADAQIARPQLGYVMDSGGALRPVIGIAAAASLGDSALDHATSFACSAALCLAKTDSALVAFAPAIAAGSQNAAVSQITPVPSGFALIAIDDGVNAQTPRAWIYFAASQQMALWQNGALEMINFAPGGDVLSLRAAAGGFDYVANAWIEHYSEGDGTVMLIGPAATGASTPDTFAPTAVALIDAGVLTTTSDQLILTRPDGEQITFPLMGAQAIYSAGKGYVEIVGSDGLWILRTDSGQEQLSLLPGVAQGETSSVATQADAATAGAGAAQ